MKSVLVTASVCAVVLASSLAGRAQRPPIASAPTPTIETVRTPSPAPASRKPQPAVAHGAKVATSGLSPEQQTVMVAQYCATCHSERAKAGGLSLAGFKADEAPAHAETVEKMIRKLRAGMMPPAGAKRPAASELEALTAALERSMDAHLALDPNPGTRPFQRLNRAEYAQAVEDLLGLEVDVTAFLPPDTVSAGYDNVADVQTFSPALMEGYLRAASRVTLLAVGDPESAASEATYKVAKTVSQLERVDGAPLGTRGGISVLHTFPADGDYVFRMEFFAEPLGLLFGSTSPGEQIELSIDGTRVALLDINPRMSEETTGLALRTPAVHVKAGPQRVTAAFIQRSDGLNNDLMAPIDHTLADTEIGIAFGITTLPHLRGVSIVGPHRVTGVSDTVSRRKIFTCRPTSAAEEGECAAEIVRSLATKAFRRPVSDRDFTQLFGFYERGRQARNFEYGVAKALEAVLASPQFLFRLEEVPPTSTTARSYKLADLDLASRLSFFLWASGPDAELISLAQAGKLSQPATLKAQTARMLADPRSQTLATRFGAQWLRLQDLDKTFPDSILFPYYDDKLGQAFKRETELFFDSLIRDDRSVLELLTADYTFANERLARHYGIAGVSGDGFRRVPVPEYRRGILGHGSVLALTSIADRTSPVMRGKWVMEVLLGSPPPPPPPNVPALEETSSVASGKMLSVRGRMEEHRRNPACTSCHKVIDPLGLALENFDATGKWRVKDGEAGIDPTGDLYDGTPIDGPAGLRAALLKHKDAFLLSFTENLMTYGLGRRVETFDMATVRHIIRAAEQHDFKMSGFINGIIASPAFQMSRTTAVETTAVER